MSAPAYLSSPSQAPAPDDEPRCPNCGTVAARNFCPECGQECISVRLSLRDLAHEFLDDHVGWSTKVPRTMSRLLFQPGVLTRDFIEGRRVRYLSPLRLYLSLSVLFFLVMASPPSWSGRIGRTSVTAQKGTERNVNTGPAIRFGTGTEADDAETTAARDERVRMADSLNAELLRHFPDTTSWRARFKARTMRRNIDIGRMSGAERTHALLAGLATYMPRVMFALLPLFALCVKLLYWRRRRFYAEHFIFALHTHAVAYALLTLGILSPWFAAWKWLALACGLSFVLALRRVYGGGIVKTLLKTVAIGGVYTLVVSVATVGVIGFLYLFG